MIATITIKVAWYGHK